MATIDEHQAQIKAAILDVLAYGAAVSYPLKADQIYHYLPHSCLKLPFEQALRELEGLKKIQQSNGFWSLPGHDYRNPHDLTKLQAERIKKATTWLRLLYMLPFVRAVAVLNNEFIALEPLSEIDLFVLTKPHRLYCTKAIYYFVFRILRQKPPSHKPLRFNTRFFISTNGVNFRRDIVSTPDQVLPYFFISATPIFGEKAWQSFLHRQTWLVERFANWPWPKTTLKLPSVGWRVVDKLDEQGYREHLRHVARQEAYKQPGSFLRLRPDIINQQPHDTSTEITERYTKIRGTIN